jgi:hypothetical protein
MTTSSAASEPALPDVRGWAAAQLELKPDATPERVRAALLRRLPEDDFVLPLRCQHAALFLLRPADGAERVSRHGQAPYDEEDRLRLEVDAFAAEFFKLALSERRRRWQELSGRCAFSPPLTARLRGLERGLDVALEKVAATDVRELAERVCDLFVLRPAARAVRRQEVLREMGTNPARWQAAARQLQTQAPPVAALALVLVEELANWEKRLRQQRKPAAPLPAAGQASGAQRGSNGVAAVIVLVAIMVVHLAFRGSGGSSGPKYSVPTFPALPGKNDAERQRMLRELDQGQVPRLSPEMKKLLEEWKQKEKDAGRDRAPPPGPPAPLPGPQPPP